MSKIQLSTPNFSGNEWKYVKECLDSEWVSSAGKFVNLFEEKIAKFTGAKFAIACVNGTSALQISLKLAGVQPGDEVIVPTLTFIAPVNVIAYNGASPIFMDSDDYYNIDEGKTIEFINHNTVFKNGFTYNKKTNKKISAIVPVHVFGNAALLDDLLQICKLRNISVVEDAAESLGTRYKNGRFTGKHTGTIGLLGCLSFNGNKIITTGGGGMILTQNSDLAEKAKYLTQQAKDDSTKFLHNEIGYNFRLTNIQAALGLAQLEQLEIFLEHKKNIFDQYKNRLNNVEGLSIAPVPDYANNNHWMNLLRIDSKNYGEDPLVLMKRLKNNGIQTRPVWVLNHLQKPYRDCQNVKAKKAEELLNISLCLPSSSNLTNCEIKYIFSHLEKSR